MNASESSPVEGLEFDGESYEQTVRCLLRSRIDGVEHVVKEAVVEADREVRGGGDLDDALAELSSELTHARIVVEEARDALPEAGESEEE